MVMKRLLNLTTVFFLLTAVALQAQTTVRGVVTDAETNEPLIGANVVLKGTASGTTADVNGNFSLTANAPLPWTLDISYTGFTTESVQVNNADSKLEIKLKTGALIGQEVVVSASRRREKVQEAPASITVLNSRKLAASANDNPVRNLISAPGVNIQQASAGRINIHLRGDGGIFGSASFPMLDYRPLVGAGTGTFDALNTPLNNIDIQRIEVVRGPGSALYGPGVTAGVIHFLSKSPIDHPGTTVQLRGGELSTFGASIRHATKVSDKFGFKINANYTRGDEFNLDPDDPGDAASIAALQDSIYQPVIKDGVVDPTQRGELLWDVNDTDEDGDGNPLQNFYTSAAVTGTLEFRPQDDFSVNVSGGFNSASGVFFNDQGEGLAQSTDTWGQARMQKGGLFAQAFFLSNRSKDDKPTFLYRTGNRTLNDRKQFEGQIQYNFDLPSILNSNWTTGFDYRRSINETGNTLYGRNEDDDDYSIAGLYVQGKFALAKKLDLVLAGRGDRFNSLDETGFSPRAALVFKASPKHTFRASYNRAIRTPSQLNLNIDFPLATLVPSAYDIWLVGNKNAVTFGENPMLDFNGALPFPSLPFGTPGMPLNLVQGAVTQQAGQQILEGVATQLTMANPAIAPLIPLINAFLTDPANFATGTTGTFAGVDLFTQQPLNSFTPGPKASLIKEDTWEFGYVGLIADKLKVSLDVYNRTIDGDLAVSALAPSYGLVGIDAMGTDLGAGVAAQLTPFLVGLLTQAGNPNPEAAAAQIAGAYAAGYTNGGNGFAQGIALLADNFLLATVQSEDTPDNGVVHVPAGYKTFEAYSYTGLDVSLEYYVNSDLSFFGNYSYISENVFETEIKDSDGVMGTNALSIPKNKFRFGANYGPELGWRANLSFQHDDSFESFSGLFSGKTDKKNAVDLGVGYKFDFGLTINVSGQNIFNNEYRAFPGMPKIGRRTLATVTYDFGSEKK